MIASRDTIVAVATPPGKGGVGIVRVSGPQVKTIAKTIIGQLPTPRVAQFSCFRSPEGYSIDEGIALFFASPYSFTGEDVLELQGHGGPVVMDALMQAVLAQGARLARPGEFSERAYLNDKMDLAQAEAVADLINASSKQAAQSALRSLQGDFSKQIYAWLDELVRLRKMVEAAIDFPEEEIDFIAESNIEKEIEALKKSLETIQAVAKQGVLLQEGLYVAIVGKPNVGKSSLLNCLCGRDAAIVTDVPGTTRDLLSESIQVDGLPIHIVDTAGIRETKDVVEQEGVRRAKEAIQKADLVLQVEDVTEIEPMTLFSKNQPTVRIKNKIDLLKEGPSINRSTSPVEIKLSVTHQRGIELLEDYLKEFSGFSEREGGFIARRRHLEAIGRCKKAIVLSLEQLKKNKAPELVAEDLREAQKALSEITGEFTSDDLLGEIFSSFCIGK